jgi:hypothetical protein
MILDVFPVYVGIYLAGGRMGEKGFVMLATINNRMKEYTNDEIVVCWEPENASIRGSALGLPGRLR